MKNKVKYKEFVKYIQTETGKHTSFWKRYLSGFYKKNTFLCYTKSNRIDNGYYKQKLGKVTSTKLIQFCTCQNITLATIFYSVWAILLREYTDCKDIVFGTTVSGRNTKVRNIEDTIGLFINTIPIRILIDEECTIHEFLDKVSNNLIDRNEYENTPLNEIQSIASTVQQGSLFDNIVVIENYPINPTLTLDKDISITGYSVVDKTNYDLTLGIFLLDEFQFTFEYKKSKFKDELIKRMCMKYQYILEFIVNNKNKKIKDILTRLNKREVIIDGIDLEEVENHETFYWNNLCLNSEYQLSKVEKLATLIQGKGVKKNSKVAIILQNTIDQLIAIIACIRVGKSFFILDTSYDTSYYNTLCCANNCKLFITDQSDSYQDSLDGELINIKEEKADLNVKKLILDDRISALEYGYLRFDLKDTFTNMNGSIKRVIRYAQWFKRKYSIGENDNILYVENKSEEQLLINIVIALVCNIQLQIVPSNTEISEIDSIVRTNKISILDGDSKVIEKYILNSKTIKQMKNIYVPIDYSCEHFVEKLKKQQIISEINFECIPERLQYKCIRINEKSKDIGTLYTTCILNSDHRICDDEIIGRVAIISQEDLTEYGLEKVALSDLGIEEKKEVYVTDLLGRVNINKRLEIVGVKDEQYYLNDGVLSLGRLKEKLLQNIYIKDAYIEYKNQIIAYLLLKQKVDINQIKTEVSKTLPYHMIPDKFVIVDQYQCLRRKSKDYFLTRKELQVKKDLEQCNLHSNIFNFD